MKTRAQTSLKHRPARSPLDARPSASSALGRAAAPAPRRGRWGLAALGTLALFAALGFVAWPDSRPASPQPALLQAHSASLGLGLNVPTPGSGLRPSRFDRGVTCDGGARVGTVLPLTLGADPLAVTLEERRVLGGGAGASVDLATGAAVMRDVQIALPAVVPWIVGTQYGSGQSSSAAGEPCTYSSDGPQGWNWSQLMAAEVVRDEGSGGWGDADDLIRLVYGPNAFVEYHRVGSGVPAFASVNGAAGVLTITPSTGAQPEVVSLVDPSGSRVSFLGFEGFAPGTPASVFGQLWKVENASDDAAYVGDAIDAAQAASVGYAGGLLRVAYDSAGRRYDYTYSTTAIGTRVRLKSIIATQPAAWEGEEVARVEYAYYGEAGWNAGGGGDHGLAGDLASIKVTTSVATQGTLVSQVRQRVQRYWTGLESSPPSGCTPRAHGLKTALGYEGVRRGVVDLGSLGTLMALSDEALAPRAEAELRYDDAGRVNAASFDGLRAAGAAPTYRVTYETAGAGDWARRAITGRVSSTGSTTGAGRLFSTHYFDAQGQALSLVLTEGEPADASTRWCHAAKRDAGGMLLFTATPASVSGYTHATGALSMSGTSGVVTHLVRDAGSEHAGVLAGFVRGVRVNQSPDASGSSYVSTVVHAPQTLDTGAVCVTAPFISAVRAYPQVNTTGGASSVEWQFETQVWAGTLAVQSVRTREPIVSTLQHGSGAALYTKQWYRKNGTPQVHQSQRDRLTVTKHDPLTGLLTESVRDAAGADIDTPGPSLTSGNAVPYRVAASFTYDALGRVLTATDGRGRVSARAYSVLAGGETVALQVARRRSAAAASCTKVRRGRRCTGTTGGWSKRATSARASA